MELKGRSRAYANIALIKYWGKLDEKLVLPMNSSLSLTLDALYTETEVIFQDKLERDYFYLNNMLEKGDSHKRVSQFLDLFRHAAKLKLHAIVKSKNFFPTAAGLASSASGFAALAAAANVATGLKMGKKELSTYARKGSGSASRSIYGGFVEWKMGKGDADSYALAIDRGNWDVAMLIVVISKRKKQVSSREGMKRTVESSPFHKAWVKTSRKDLKEIKRAIRERDLKTMGTIMERNSLGMHGTMLGAIPPIFYWQPATIVAMEVVRDLRLRGIPAYFTIDAGPNVKILSRRSQSHIIKENLLKYFDREEIILSGPGPGVRLL